MVVQKFNVTEKDMPPHHIITLATEIGFSNYCCYPFPEDVVEHTAGCVTDAATRRQLSWRKRFQRQNRDVRNLKRNVAALFGNASRTGGLVVLTK